MSSVDYWRVVARRGVLEVLDVLRNNGQLRFSKINDKVKGLCLASLTNALTLAREMDLIEKKSYIIADTGKLQEITEEEMKKGVKPQASFYKIRKKGEAVLILQEELVNIIGSTP